MFKSLKQNFAPFLFAAIGIGLLTFPIWSHFSQEKELTFIKEEVSNMTLCNDDILVGASTLFAQNASVQLNLEVLGTYASVSGNLSFGGEIMPDGSTCSDNQILKRTGANDWDCAADADSGSVGAADSDIPFVTIGNTASLSFEIALTGTANQITVTDGGANGNVTLSIPTLLVGTGASFSYGEFTVQASASAYFGTAFGGIDCNDAGDQLLWSGGLFTCEALADADIPDAITVTGGTIGANNISGTQTTTGTTTFGDGGDAVDFATSTWDITAGVLTGLTISTNNVTGTWTTTGNLTIGDNGDDVIIDSDTWNVSSLGAFTGLTGITSTGVIDFGGADSFELPNSAGGGTIDAAGEAGVDTTAGSFNYYDGTAERVLHNFECKTFATDTFSAKDQWGGLKFREPATIFEVSPVASGSLLNVGWTLRHGAAGTVTTNLFTAAYKAASASSYPTYTTFADATLADNEVLDFVLASTSAGTGELGVNVCWRYDP